MLYIADFLQKIFPLENFADAAMYVMQRMVTYSHGLNKTHQDYALKFRFEFLEDAGKMTEGTTFCASICDICCCRVSLSNFHSSCNKKFHLPGSKNN